MFHVQSVRNQRGQTLLELMVIIALLGLGLAIAIPYCVYKDRQDKIEVLEKQLQEERNKRDRASQQKISTLESEINRLRGKLGLKPKTRGKEDESSTASTVAWWGLVFLFLGGALWLGRKGLDDYHKRKMEPHRVGLEKMRIQAEERAVQEGKAILARQDQQYERLARVNKRKKRNKGKGKNTPSE